SASLKTDESHQGANYSFRPCWERARSFNRTGAALVPDREILAGGDVRFSAVAVARYCPGASTASKWKWPARSAFVVQRSLGSSALVNTTSVPAAGLPSGLRTIPSTADPVCPRGAAVLPSSICRFFSFFSGFAGGDVCPTITQDPNNVNATNEAGNVRRK